MSQGILAISNKIACASSKDSDQPALPCSLIMIRVLAGHLKMLWVLRLPAVCGLWSDCVGAQADLSLCWAHINLVGNAVARLIYEPMHKQTLQNAICECKSHEQQSLHICAVRSDCSLQFLALCILDNKFSRWHFEIIFRYIKKNKKKNNRL